VTVYYSRLVGPLPLESGRVLTAGKRADLPEPDGLVGSDAVHYGEGRLVVAPDDEQGPPKTVEALTHWLTTRDLDVPAGKPDPKNDGELLPPSKAELQAAYDAAAPKTSPEPPADPTTDQGA
jgi:hypothetical protein